MSSTTAERLTDAQARALRMRALLLGPAPAGGDAPATPGDVVQWFGAMQAQDVASGHWSFGVRLPGMTEADVNQAVLDRRIVRTWPMRGTIHFVPPADAHLMLDLAGPRVMRGVERRWEFLGIDEAHVRRAADALAVALAGGRIATRAECLEILTATGLDSLGQRGYHYLWYASQIGVTVIGPQVSGEQTFTLLDDWVPTPNRPTREEALATLTRRYFQSHGPASAKDFAGWADLPMGEVRSAIAGLGAELAQVEVDGVSMHLMAQALADPPRAGRVPMVLPGFDEYLLGFKDRRLMASPEVMAAVIPGGNGIFRSTVVLNGQVKATWKRAVKKTRVDVQVLPLGGWRPTAAVQARLESEFDAFARFLGVPAAVVSYA